MDAPVGFEMSNRCEVDTVEPIRTHVRVQGLYCVDLNVP